MRTDLPTGGAWNGAGEPTDFVVGPSDTILPTREQIRERALDNIRSMVDQMQPGDTLTVKHEADGEAAIFTVTRTRPAA